MGQVLLGYDLEGKAYKRASIFRRIWRWMKRKKRAVVRWWNAS